MTKSTSTEAYSLMAETLIQLRRDAGLTQGQLAHRLGKPQAFVSTVERGNRRIDIIEFYAITRALEADPVSVFAQIVRILPGIVEI
jgi:transcriptional regulator with XRE-family HTH domain